MTRPTVVHLVDDTTAGGVMRLLDHIHNSPDMARAAQHKLRVVKRGRLTMRRIKADIIVSHMVISWRTLPALLSLRALNAGTPMIHVEHSYTQGFAAHNVPNKKRFLNLLRIGYSVFDHLVAVSHAQARWMFRHRLADLGALTVISPVVGLDGFAALPAPSPKAQVFGAIGRLDQQKGFDLLIQAFRALPNPDVQLNIYGEGPERPALQALAEGDARIRFLGHAKDPVAAMRCVDAVVMPSRWEAYGLVAIEARAAGRPVLVSGVDGLDDQAADGAIRVHVYNATAWKNAMAELATYGAPSQSRPNPKHAEQDFAARWADVLARVRQSDSQAALVPQAQ
jgi:glycosyltransferase involved in cell wall biosynthesis